MRALVYSVREGVASLRRSGGATVFAVVSIALATLVLGGLLLVTSNIDRLLDSWSSAAEFSVYLRDDASSEQRAAIELAIDQSGVAEGRQHVSKAEALSRFRKDFADLAKVADSTTDNPFPASLEVQVRPEAHESGRVDALVASLLSLPGVADVRYDRQWISRVTSGLMAVRRAGIALAVVMLLAAALTVGAVVRLALHARRDELEIMQLVGSPYGFIRGPFVAEGLLQGGIGAAVALAILWGAFSAGVAAWGPALGAVIEPQMLRFLPATICGWLVVGGMAVGSAGGLAAAWSQT